ncbi:hypothetical protein V5799_011482 [Amblyomma americanum]|uniref:Fatty acid synthase n=1 Tax=Amblyomma americanum TaxID=6943 RepID=A0AAQ4EGY7_AMBAM
MGLLSTNGLATVVAADPALMWEVPDAWSLEEACTVPVAYSTAYYALLVRGNLRPGESLLVHCGSEGVGQAAIAVAVSLGCTVYTTVGCNKEREFLKHRFSQLEDRNIADLQDLSFEKHVHRESKHRGVDVVLNSLSGEKLEASVRCLAPNGRFLEVGKFDVAKDSQLGMPFFRKSATFCGIHQEALNGKGTLSRRASDPARTEETTRTTAPASFLAVGAEARTWFYENKSYVVIGGLGGFGVELANWIVGRGCRSLLLSSRSGVRTGYKKLQFRRWHAAGVKVRVTRADASTACGARKIIDEASTMGAVGGIFNLGLVLRDALLESQTPEALETVCRVKVGRHTTLG